MHIWVDGDACPRVIKDILFRAATRTQTGLTLVANQAISIPPSPWIKRWQVGAGFDRADDYIVQQIHPGDLIITADIPLADEAISKGALALNPRGTLYSISNIKPHLAARNRNEVLRGSNQLTVGPMPLNAREVQLFAKHLDQLLTRRR